MRAAAPLYSWLRSLSSGEFYILNNGHMKTICIRLLNSFVLAVENPMINDGATYFLIQYKMMISLLLLVYFTIMTKDKFHMSAMIYNVFT